TCARRERRSAPETADTAHVFVACALQLGWFMGRDAGTRGVRARGSIAALLLLLGSPERGRAMTLLVMTEGASAEEIAAPLRSSLAEGFTLADPAFLRSKPRDIEAIRRESEAEGIDGVIVVRVRATKRERTAHLVIVPVRDGATVSEVD